MVNLTLGVPANGIETLLKKIHNDDPELVEFFRKEKIETFKIKNHVYVLNGSSFVRRIGDCEDSLR